MRSFAVCDKPKKVRQQVNILSSFIDGSMIYGVEKEKLIRMRTNDGKSTFVKLVSLVTEVSLEEEGN